MSHNRSDVDVYLLCGEATRCGWASFRRVALFMEIPRPKLRCAVGLNFFLVVPDLNQGYWVGPLYPTGGWSVRLVVETYAGLSTAYLQR